MNIRLYETILLAMLGLFGFSVHAAQQAVILQYHHVDSGTPASTSITPALFDEHIQYIRENGYTVWPLDDAVDAVRHNKLLPDKAIVITIDDAYQSVYTEIYPRMKKLGWSFTVFVNSDAHDSRQGHYISWDQMREMKQHGAIFANHTNSHLHLLRMQPGENQTTWLARVRKDIELGQRRLEEELGDTPKLFAYPYGEHNPELRKLVTDLGMWDLVNSRGPLVRSRTFPCCHAFPWHQCLLA